MMRAGSSDGLLFKKLRFLVRVYTALVLAILGNHSGVVRALLDKGARIDRRDKDDWTALMVASKNGHLNVVQALLAGEIRPGVCRGRLAAEIHL